MSQLIQLLIVERKARERQDRADAARKESTMNSMTQYVRDQMDPHDEEVVVVPEDQHRRDANDAAIAAAEKAIPQHWANYHEWMRRARVAQEAGNLDMAVNLVNRANLELKGIVWK